MPDRELVMATDRPMNYLWASEKIYSLRKLIALIT